MDKREILAGLSDDEIMSVIKERRAGEQSPALFRTVEIEGLEVRIDLKRAKSWKAFRIMERTQTGDAADAIAAMLELVEYVTDCDEGKILGHMGEDASTEDVLRVIAGIFTEIAPKNS